jgi:tight adherence protein B
MSAVQWLALCAGVAGLPANDLRRDRVRRLAGLGRVAAIPQPLASVARAVTMRRAATAGVCSALGALVVVAGVVPAAVFAAMLATAGFVARQAARRRAAEGAARVHADAIGLVVAELRAGSRPEQALRAAAELDPAAPWRRAADTIAADGDPADVLAGGHGLDGVAHAWRVAARAGAPFASVLERIAADHNAALEQRRAVHAALAGAHASAAVLAVLPVIGVALGAAMGLHPMSTLLHTPAGHLLCCLGATFDAAGVLWTARIVTGGLRS